MNNMLNRSRRLFLAWVLLTLAIALVLGACSNATTRPEETSETASSEQTTLTVAMTSDAGIDQLDAGAYNGSMHVQAMIYDSLVEYGEKGEIVPGLAESWEISEDGTVYTFHLRQGVTFSDGLALNAEAVVFSFERWIHDPANSLQIATALEAIEAVDEHTFTMTFNKAYYPFLTELSFARPVRILSPSAVEPAGDVNGEFIQAVGSGAWMVESYVRDRETILVPNPHYWGEAPEVDRIVLKVIPDPQSRVMALQSGEVDIAGTQLGRLPVESLPVIEGDDALELLSAEGTNSHFMIFNPAVTALQDLHVRQAVNLAINKASIVEDLMDGVGHEAKGLFPLTVPYVTETNQQWYGYDPEEARQLLAKAGYTDADGDGVVEKDGQPLTLNLVLQQAEFPEWKAIGELMQYELQEIGIDLKLQMLEPNSYYDALWTTKAYDLILYRTYDDAYNPHSFLLSLFRKTADTPAVAWSDRELEALIDTAVGSTDLEERQATYDAIFARMYEQAMFAAVYYPEEIVAVNQRVSDFAFGHSTFRPILWQELKVGDR
ncbi:nickel ABC transporter substrate-binding protein [Paenibacillus daejeonensis]|uniref:nickel ABC transporter substrate-binding protein n=1 Tax=Paenibacillus daejeonensis TaxID=135193 RepID=UPI00036E8372|nr:nickel ABC transporter substrate-binding protein [Paenibacillus daejeonensis]